MTSNGFKDATTDPNTITQWWRQHPDANIGIATGKVSGLAVLDVDINVEEGKHGDKTLAALEAKHEPLPKTVKAKTGGGGVHHYFARPSADKVKSAANAFDQWLDCKADGGYVIAPPSVHPDTGLPYTWVDDHKPFKDLHPAPPPDWLACMVVSSGSPKKEPHKPHHTDIDLNLVQSALKKIPADDYDTWTKIGMALHNIGQRGLWDDWSRQSEKYNERNQEQTWRSFKADGGISIGTVFALAEQHGWMFPKRQQKASANDDVVNIPPSDPEPLRREPPPPPAFPMDALGDVLAPAATRLYEVIQSPETVCCMSVLAAAALATQGHADVIIDGRHIPLSLFLLTIADSGDRKSSTDDQALRSHRERQRQLAIDYRAELTDYEAERAAWRKAYDTALKPAGKGKERSFKAQQEAIAAALKELGPEPEPPLTPSLLTTDPTFEGVYKLLATGQPSIGLFSDEGGRFFGGHAMNKDNSLKTAASLSTLWDGKPIDRVRAGDGSSILFGRRLSLHLMLQPVVAETVFSQRILSDQGFLARCLTAWPVSNAGNQVYQAVDLMQNEAIKRYNAHLLEALEKTLPVEEDTRNQLNPRSLPLDPDAKSLWIEFHNEINRQRGDGFELHLIKAFASKIPDQVLRIAGVLTLVDDLEATTIPLGKVADSIKIADFFLSEQLRIHDMAVTDPDVILAEKLLKWCQPFAYIYPRKIYREGPNAIRDRATALRIAEILANHGWLVPVQGGAMLDGSHRRQVWEVRRLS